MIDRAFLARARIEPLDRNKHDRAAFSCGVDRVDNFLKKTASRHQDEEYTRVYVACLDDGNEVIGYYAVNSHAIDVGTLHEKERKKLPYPTVPAIYVSVVGVHSQHQGKGLGTRVMGHAFQRCLDVADKIGAYVVVLDALNERAAKFYRELGFIDLPNHELRMIMRIQAIRRARESSAQIKGPVFPA
jgi:GNAT superfamily N-acetyltransferase